jgi:hypothetical protein
VIARTIGFKRKLAHFVDDFIISLSKFLKTLGNEFPQGAHARPQQVGQGNAVGKNHGP